MAIQDQEEIYRRLNAEDNRFLVVKDSSHIMIAMEGRECGKGFLPIDAVVHKIDELKRTFVKTKAFGKAFEVLKQCDHVTLTGAPGVGKTSTALMLCDEFRRSNYEVIFVDDLDSFSVDRFYSITSNTCFVLDDLFGTIDFSTNVQKIKTILAFFKNIFHRKLTKKEMSRASVISTDITANTSVSVKVVITSKTFNFNAGRTKLPEYDLNLFKENSIVDHSEDWSKDSKREMIRKLKAEFPQVDLTEEHEQQIIESENSVFGFPLIIKLYFSEPAYHVKGVQFFNEPIQCIRMCIDGIVSEGNSRSLILILLVLCGGKLDLLSFQENYKDVLSVDLIDAVHLVGHSLAVFDIYKAAKNFKGTYLHIEDEFASFSHPSICDAVTCAMVSFYPFLLLKHCPLQFIFERVRVNRKDERGELFVDPGTNFIYLTPRYAEMLIGRLCDHMKKNHFRLTVTHPIFKDKLSLLQLSEQICKYLCTISRRRDKESGRSFLYYCTELSNDCILEKALDSKQKSHEKAAIKESIKASIQNGNFTAFKRLLNYFESKFKRRLPDIAKEMKLVTAAAKFGRKDIFTYLKSGDADLHIKDEDGKTILHRACELQHLDIVDLIPEDNIKRLLPEVDFNQKTALMTCADVGHFQLFKRLHEQGAELTATSLQYASMKGHLDIVEYIADKKQCFLKECLKFGRTAVMLSAKYGREQTFKFLEDKEYDVSLTDDFNDNILHLSAIGGSSVIVDSILSTPSVDINARGKHNRNAVMISAEHGQGPIFEKTALRRSRHYFDNFKNTCLHLACYGGDMTVFMKMIELQRTKIMSRNIFGQTPILIAAQRGFMEIVKALIQEGASRKDTDNGNNNCLHLACKSGNTILVKYLLDFHFDVNTKGHLGWTPLMFSIMQRHVNIFKILSLHQADTMTKDDNNNDLLWAACWSGNSILVSRILSLPDPDKISTINRRGENGWTPVMVAAEKGHKEVFDAVVAKGPSLELSDDFGNDCLYLAAAGGNISIVGYLLSNKDIKFHINKPDQDGWTPIMVASRSNHKECVQMLHEEGADITLKDKEHNTCLSLASMSTGGEVVSYLLSIKEFDHVKNAKGSHDRTPVLIAASCGNVQAFNALVSKGMDISMFDNQKYDCLGLAAAGGSVSIVNFLVNSDKFSINREGCNLRTPIMEAVANGHFKVFQILIGMNAVLTGVDDEENDCLTLAAKGGSPRVMKYLLSLNQFDINRPGSDKLTPVLTAAKHGHHDAFFMLVERGTDLKTFDSLKNDVLMLASVGGNVQIVKYLLSKKICNIERLGQFIRTPVMAACSNGQRQVFDLLRKEDAKLNLKDADENGCLSLACVGDHSDLVRYLLSLIQERKQIFEINCRGKRGRTPVMQSVVKGHVKTFFVLARTGADLTLTDQNNKSCTELAKVGNSAAIKRHLRKKKKKVTVRLPSCVKPY